MVYSERNWGELQARDYAAAIDEAAKRLEEFLQSGPLRDDLIAGCRRLPAERHVIYYRIDASTVRILRILHERMNPKGQLTGSE